MHLSMPLKFLIHEYWTGWRRWAAWLASAIVLALLGVLRAATDAEFAFASLALFPVLAIGWIDGKKGGLLIAVLAAAMWDVGDYVAGRQFSALWIPAANAATRVMTYGVVAVLIAAFREQYEREHIGATRDSLTDLLNRRSFVESGITEVSRAQRYGHSLAVVYLDLDNFKKLNDTKGHEAGDKALLATARAATGALRTSDVAARLGGDEFAFLLPETGFDATKDVGNKLLLVSNCIN